MEEEGQEPDLRALREAKDLDLASLSSATSLSIAQLRELEEGGSGHFYSEAIKLQAVDDILALEQIARAILQFDSRA